MSAWPGSLPVSPADVDLAGRSSVAHRAVTVWRVLSVIAVACLALGVILHQDISGSRRAAVSGAHAGAYHREGLLSLPLAAQGPVSAALGGNSKAYGVASAAGGLRAANPAQHLSASFTANGVAISSGLAQLGLALRGVGYGSPLRTIGPSLPRASANRVDYAPAGGVRAWYANGPLGLEQGFDLATRPGSGRGPLTLSLSLRGDMRARLGGGGVIFSGAGVAFRYGGLIVSDARGRRLSAWFALRAGRVLIRVADRGARYPLRIDPFVQQGSKLTGSGATSSSGFGYSVALSADGNTALIATPYDNGDVGAAWVFTRTGTTWTQQGSKLTANDETTRAGCSGGCSEFGYSAALSSDGNTALIGGPDDNSQVGAAWVFTRSGTTWTQQGSKLTGSGETGLGQGYQYGTGLFGSSVALSSDGNTALIGGPADGNTVHNYIGAVWVFTRSGSTWTQQGSKLAGSGETGSGDFGNSVALSSDGGTALIGGYEDNSAVGAAWVFTAGVKYDISGTVYGQRCDVTCSRAGLPGQTILVQGTASDGSMVSKAAVSGADGAWSVMVPSGSYVAGPTLNGETIDGRGFDPEESPPIAVGAQSVAGVDFVTCAGTTDDSVDVAGSVSPREGAAVSPRADPGSGVCYATYGFQASADIPQKEFVDPSPSAPYADDADGKGYKANNQHYGEWHNTVPECEDFAYVGSHKPALEWYSYYRGTRSLGSVRVNLAWDRYTDVVSAAGSAITKGSLTRVVAYREKDGKDRECEESRPVWPEVSTSTQGNSFKVVISWALPFTAAGVETPESEIKGLPGVGKGVHTLVEEAVKKVDGFEALSYRDKQAVVYLVAETIEHSLAHVLSRLPSLEATVELVEASIHYEKSVNLPALIAQVGWGVVAAQVEEISGYHPMVMVIRGQLTTGHCPSAVVLIHNTNAYRLCDTTSLATDVTTDPFPDYHLGLLRNGKDVSTVTDLYKPQQVEMSAGPDAATFPDLTHSSEDVPGGFPAFKIRGGNRDMNDLYKAMKRVGPGALQAEAGTAIYGPADSALGGEVPACRNIDHYGTSHTRCYTWLDLSP